MRNIFTVCSVNPNPNPSSVTFLVFFFFRINEAYILPHLTIEHAGRGTRHGGRRISDADAALGVSSYTVYNTMSTRAHTQRQLI